MRPTANYCYRGYDIVPSRRWRTWFVGVYAAQPDVPVLSHNIFGSLAEQKDVAIAEAKRVIDRMLADFDPLHGTET